MADIRIAQLLDEKSKRKYKDYLNETPQKFIERIEGMKDMGATPNRPLLELYERCVKFQQESPLVQANEDAESIDVAVVGTELSVAPHQNDVIALPVTDEAQPLFKQLQLVASQAISCLSQGRLKTTKVKAERLGKYFEQQLSLLDIAKEELIDVLPSLSEKEAAKKLRARAEAVRLAIADIIARLFNGEVFKDATPNFCLSSELVQSVKALREEALYGPVDDFRSLVGLLPTEDMNEHVVKYFLSLEAIDVNGISFMACPDTKLLWARAFKEVSDRLGKSFNYISYDELLSLLPDYQNNSRVKSLLDQHLANLGTETNDEGGVRLKTCRLMTAYVRQARIIFDAPNSLTKDEIEQIYQETYQEEMGILQGKSLGDIGFVCSGTLWSYANKLKDLKTVVAECVENKGYVVTWDDVVTAVKAEGLRYPDKTIRACVTNICTPSNKDKNLFCHKEHVSEHPEHEWRVPAVYGQTNVVVNLAIEKLQECGNAMAMSGLRDYLTKEMEQRGYNLRMLDAILSKYEEGDFWSVDNDCIQLNTKALEGVDLKVIGLRGRQYTMSIVSVAINELRKRGGQALFTELTPIIQQSIPSDTPISPRVIKDAIKSDWSDEITLKTMPDGRLIAVLVQQIVEQPTYEIVATTDEQESDPVMVEVTERKEAAPRSAQFEWDKLVQKLQTELQFYIRPSMFGMTFDLTEALARFKQLMSQSKNANLNTIIPQNLYEYWFCATDSYDRNRYFCDLARCFEALLRDIKEQAGSLVRRTKGLNDLVEEYYPTLYLGLHEDNPYGISRVLQDLSKKRNMLAHGDYVELGSVAEAQTIVNYVALYVYVAGTYFKNTNR